MTVSKRLRYEVLRRDNYVCHYCHRVDLPLIVEHVIPLALGGRTEPGNLVAACEPCNSGKAASNPDAPLVDTVADDVLRWGRAMRIAAVLLRGQEAEQHKAEDRVLEAWQCWTYGPDRRCIPLPPDWRVGIASLMHAGLPVDLIVSAVDLACPVNHVPLDRRWAYLCGICWRKVETLRESAAALVTERAEADADDPDWSPPF